MTLPPRLRKLALAAHVTGSVGWVGAIAAFLVLAIIGRDDQLVRAAYIAMDVIARFVIVPLAFASLVTGIISSLGTAWGEVAPVFRTRV